MEHSAWSYHYMVHVSTMLRIFDSEKSSEDQILQPGFVPIISSHVHSTESQHDESHLNPISAEQNFFPLFYGNGPFLNHHAVVPHSSGRYLTSPKASADRSILGSGDFTVLKGGTFYSDNEDFSRPPHIEIKGGRFYESIQNGRPFALPLEASNDPFANFKDFADITGGVEADFSHFIAMYANQNSSKAKHEPKNILEQLQLIEEERSNEKIITQDTKTSTSKSLNKFKKKLMSTVLSKELRKKELPRKRSNPPMSYVDPLEADS